MPWESACDLTGIGRRGVNWIGAPAHLCWPSHRRRHCTKFLTPKTSRCALLRHALNIAKEIICFPNSHVTFPQTQRQGDGKDNASQGGASRYAKTELLEKQFDVCVCVCAIKKENITYEVSFTSRTQVFLYVSIRSHRCLQGGNLWLVC